MSKNIYSLPVPDKAITAVVEDNFSHQGPYKDAIDFAVPVGTSIFAAADGIVTRIEDDSDQYGDDRKFGQLVNYVTIKHAHDELSEYLHLAKGSVAVKIGDKVKQGQKIAEAGLSGWMTEPHLHLFVYKLTNDRYKFKSLKIQFNQSFRKSSSRGPVF